MENPENLQINIENSENLTIEYLKDLLAQSQLESTDLKNKLAIVHELLRRYKLNEVAELHKHIKDLQSQIKIMKANSDIQTKTIQLQKEEIHKLQEQIQNFEHPEYDEKPHKILEKVQEDLETHKILLKRYQDELHLLKSQLSKPETHHKCNSLKTENDQLKLNLAKKDEFAQNSTIRQSSLSKKIENLSKDKKLLEEKILELESDKRKLLEKWQKALSKAKCEEHIKLKSKEIEETLEYEKNRSAKLMNKLKEISKKHEDLKENFEKEKKYSSELTNSFTSLHVQYKVLLDEKEVLEKINQELSVKFHFYRPEKSTPEKQKTEYQKNLACLQQELGKSQEQLRKKNQELIDLEIKMTKNTPYTTSDFQNISQELIYYQKYESLLEKFRKLQSEKTQIQNLYVIASSVISEKTQKVQELTNKIFEFEEKFLSGHKSERLKGYSISQTTTSRGTFQ